MDECVFCKIVKGEIPSFKVYEDDRVYAFADINPVSDGHTLIIPKRHIATFFEATAEERLQLMDTLEKARQALLEEFRPDGFNIGINEGQAGGQSVMHLHIHLIPRYTGDMENPQGGVRGCIPDKQKY